jgi:hypothetical protein
MLPFDVRELNAQGREFAQGLLRACLGALFVAIAVASIEYQETIAPGLNRLSEGWSTTAADLGRRITGVA